MRLILAQAVAAILSHHRLEAGGEHKTHRYITSRRMIISMNISHACRHTYMCIGGYNKSCIADTEVAAICTYHYQRSFHTDMSARPQCMSTCLAVYLTCILTASETPLIRCSYRMNYTRKLCYRNVVSFISSSLFIHS